MINLEIYFDGASKNNPGKSSYGFVVYQLIQNQKQEIYRECNKLGIKTNNQAEYLGLTNCLIYLKTIVNSRNLYQINIYSDSLLVVSQINNFWKCKNPNLIEYKDQAQELISYLRNLNSNNSLTIKHILREKNKVADYLANLALQ